MKELSTESQKKSILDWLSEGNTITALQALNMFGCLRLASRINDLKNDGFTIVEVAEQNGNNENRVEAKLGKLLYIELLNELTSSNKHKVTITLEAL